MPLEIDCSDKLTELVEGLDSKWEEEYLPTLPFPVAYALNELRRQDYDFGQLVLGVIQALVRYLGLLAVSNYAYSKGEPDWDLNEELNRLFTKKRPTEGEWLGIHSQCAQKMGTDSQIPEIIECYQTVEKSDWTRLRLEVPEWNFRPDRQGILSALISYRNLYGHRTTGFDEERKKEDRPKILSLLRVALHLLQPVFQYEYCQTFAMGRFKGSRTFLLKGIGGFKEVERPKELMAESEAFLITSQGKTVPVFPLFVSGPEKGSLKDFGEVYLFSYLQSLTPEYMGISGGAKRDPKLSGPINDLFNRKRVFVPRKDIELEKVEQYLKKRAKEYFAEYMDQRIYDPANYVPRKGLEEKLDQFMLSDKKIFFVLGESGCGKTTALLNYAEKRGEQGDYVIPYSCEGLAMELANPDNLEQRILSDMGYGGSLGEVLTYIEREVAEKKMLVLFDALNEFSGGGALRDMSHLFMAINQLVSKLKTHSSLKLIISARIETKEVFLVGDGLPPYIDSTAYQFFNNCPYYSLEGYSLQEFDEVLARHNLLDLRDRILSFRQSGLFLNPMNLRMILDKTLIGQSKALRNRDQLVRHYVETSLRKDKQLAAVLESLVASMEKFKDMSPTIEQLQKERPKLTEQLLVNDAERLGKLEELNFLKRLNIRGTSGIPAKTIKYNHDILFEYMWRKHKNRLHRFMLKYQMGISAFMLAFLAIAFYGLNNLFMGQIEPAVSSIRATSSVSLSSEDLGLIKSLVTEFARIAVQFSTNIVGFLGFGFLLIINTLFILNRLPHMLSDKLFPDENHIMYYGQKVAHQLISRLTRKMVLWIFIPSVCVLMVLAKLFGYVAFWLLYVDVALAAILMWQLIKELYINGTKSRLCFLYLTSKKNVRRQIINSFSAFISFVSIICLFWALVMIWFPKYVVETGDKLTKDVTLTQANRLAAKRILESQGKQGTEEEIEKYFHSKVEHFKTLFLEIKDIMPQIKRFLSPLIWGVLLFSLLAFADFPVIIKLRREGEPKFT